MAATVRPPYIRRVAVLLSLGNIGILSLLPLLVDTMGRATSTLGKRGQHIPVAVLVLSQAVSLEVELAVAVLAGVYLADRVGLRTPVIDSLLARAPLGGHVRRGLLVAAAAGLAAAGATLALACLFHTIVPGVRTAVRAGASVPSWVAVVATPYGGFTKELLTRLFLMSLVAFIVGAAWRSGRHVSGAAMVIAIVAAALIFGMGHLPYASILSHGALSASVMVRSVALNGVAGLVFGWLFWKRGLEYAMVGHLAADVMLHVAPAVVVRTNTHRG